MTPNSVKLGEELDVAREQLRQEQAKSAAMRQVLEELKAEYTGVVDDVRAPTYRWSMTRIAFALSSDAGRPILERLERAERDGTDEESEKWAAIARAERAEKERDEQRKRAESAETRVKALEAVLREAREHCWSCRKAYAAALGDSPKPATEEHSEPLKHMTLKEWAFPATDPERDDERPPPLFSTEPTDECREHLKAKATDPKPRGEECACDEQGPCAHHAGLAAIGRRGWVPPEELAKVRAEAAAELSDMIQARNEWLVRAEKAEADLAEQKARADQNWGLTMANLKRAEKAETELAKWENQVFSALNHVQGAIVPFLDGVLDLRGGVALTIDKLLTELQTLRKDREELTKVRAELAGVQRSLAQRIDEAGRLRADLETRTRELTEARFERSCQQALVAEQRRRAEAAEKERDAANAKVAEFESRTGEVFDAFNRANAAEGKHEALQAEVLSAYAQRDEARKERDEARAEMERERLAQSIAPRSVHAAAAEMRAALEHHQQNCRALTGGDDRRIAAALSSNAGAGWIPVAEHETTLRVVREAVERQRDSLRAELDHVSREAAVYRTALQKCVAWAQLNSDDGTVPEEFLIGQTTLDRPSDAGRGFVPEAELRKSNSELGAALRSAKLRFNVMQNLRKVDKETIQRLERARDSQAETIRLLEEKLLKYEAQSDSEVRP